MNSTPERHPFVPPTEPEHPIEDYDFLRPSQEDIDAGNAPFRGMNPFELMEHAGAELASMPGVTKWSVTYDIQMACGVILRDKDMKNMVGWAEEEILRNKIIGKDIPEDETRKEIRKVIYGMETEDYDDAVRKKEA